MNIFLKKLSLTNFKGVKSFEVDADAYVVGIRGENAVGKTTVFDAFTWLLFGKDSADRTKFGIKPVNSDGKSVQKVEPTVEGVLDVNGVEMTLKKVYREKWVKKKGEEQSEMVGNENLFYWNDVPLQEKEYQSKIETLVQESVFKLITNPLYFNGLKWQDRRSVLLSIAGKIDDVDVLDSIATLTNKQEIFNLTNILNQGKTLAEYRKEIAAKKKKAKDDLALIPSRIDEAIRSKPEDQNYDAIRASISRLTDQISKIDDQIGDKAKANEERLKLVLDKQKQLNDLKSQVNQISHTVLEEIRDRNRKQDEGPLRIRRQITDFEVEISNIAASIATIQRRNTELEATLQPARDKYEEINLEELKFDDQDFHCPACKREFESSDIEATKETMTRNFNEDKLKRLNTIRETGIKTKADIDENNRRIGEKQIEKSEIETKLDAARAEFQKLTTAKTGRLEEKVELSETLLKNSEYASLTVRINDLTADIEESNKPTEESEDAKGLKAQKATLSDQIGDLNRKLAGEEQAKKADTRIKELKEQERSLAQLIAEYDGSEFVMDAFNKAKMNAVETRINDKFKLARFKMFDTLVNGSEVETCETMFSQDENMPLVPWTDLNTAAKIQVGIDIINGLSEFYNVRGPIWIDNRESTVRIPETSSQVINLIVAEGEPLTVVADRFEYANA